MSHTSAVVEVTFQGADVRGLLATAREDETGVWLVRYRSGLYWSAPCRHESVRVEPCRISPLIPGIEVFPEDADEFHPRAEDVPLHNCVLAALWKMREPEEALLVTHFNLMGEFRMRLQKKQWLVLEDYDE